MQEMETDIDEDDGNVDAEDKEEDNEESDDFEDSNIDSTSDDEIIKNEDAGEENAELSSTILEDGM